MGVAGGQLACLIPKREKRRVVAATPGSPRSFYLARRAAAALGDVTQGRPYRPGATRRNDCMFNVECA